MKTKVIIFAILIIFSSCLMTKNKMITDERTQRKELIGIVTREGFQKEEFRTWFDKGYDNYFPDAEVINTLKNETLFKGVKIRIIFGTWCGDSRRELPRFYKIADKVHIPGNTISVTAVDTKKTSHDKSIDGIKFTRIPTFIFYRNDKEIGRIVESTEKSLEEDMLTILKRN